MRLLLLLLLLLPLGAQAQSLPELRTQAFHKSAECNILNAKEILQLSTHPLVEKDVPDIRTLISDTKELRTTCYEAAEEILSDLIIEERNLAEQAEATLILKLQYEADSSFEKMLSLRKEISESLLDSILEDIEDQFDDPEAEPAFYNESDKTQHLIQMENTLALESERRQIFVDEQMANQSGGQKVASLLQKAHYQLTKTLLLFDDWPLEGTDEVFFKSLNAELRYSVHILSQILPFKDVFTPEEYQSFRDMLQQAVRLNLKMSEKENWKEAKSADTYREISTFTETIRDILK